MICQYKNNNRAILNNKTAIFQDGNLFRDVYRHPRNMTPLYIKRTKGAK